MSKTLRELPLATSSVSGDFYHISGSDLLDKRITINDIATAVRETMLGPLIADGDLTIQSTGLLKARSDSDTIHEIARTKIWGASDVGYFSHFDRASASAYALAQNAAGSTLLNAQTGQTVSIRNNNGDIAVFSGIAITLSQETITTGKTILARDGGQVGVGNVIDFTSGVQQIIYGQNEAGAITDAGNHGGALFLVDSTTVPGSGGAIYFGNASGDDSAVGFAAIRGSSISGTENSRGDLDFYVRTNVADTSLTRAARITSTGNWLLGTTVDSGPSLVVAESVGSLPTISTATEALFQNNVGAATSSYVSILSGISGNARLQLGDTDAEAKCFVQYTNLTDWFRINVNGSEALNITDNQNMLLGATVDSGPKLVVADGAGSLPSIAGSTQLLIQNNFIGESIAIATILGGPTGSSRLYFGDTDNEHSGEIRYNHTDDDMLFFTALSERMRLTDAGHLLVNTTNDTGGEPLHVGGGARFTGTLGSFVTAASGANLDLSRAGANSLTMSGSGGYLRLSTNGRVDSDANANVIFNADQTSTFNGTVEFNNTVQWKYYYYAGASAPTGDEIFDELATWIPNVGDFMGCVEGQFMLNGNVPYSVANIYRQSTTSIRLVGEPAIGTYNDIHLLGFDIDVSGPPSWTYFKIMSNFDAIT